MKIVTFEKILRAWMLVFGITFVISAVIFLTQREALFMVLNEIGKVLGQPASPEPVGNLWFFLALANSMMVMIAYMSFAIAWKPRANFNYLPVLIISKVTSSLTGLVFYLSTRCMTPVCLLEGGLDGARYFSSLIILTSDLPLAIIAGVLYVQGSRIYAQEEFLDRVTA
jgi:hypothetical protein